MRMNIPFQITSDLPPEKESSFMLVYSPTTWNTRALLAGGFGGCNPGAIVLPVHYSPLLPVPSWHRLVPLCCFPVYSCHFLLHTFHLILYALYAETTAVIKYSLNWCAPPLSSSQSTFHAFYFTRAAVYFPPATSQFTSGTSHLLLCLETKGTTRNLLESRRLAMQATETEKDNHCKNDIGYWEPILWSGVRLLLG